MKNISRILCVLTAAVIIMSGCYYDKENLLYPGSTIDCTVVNARFTDVKPIILTKCATAGCHNTASAAGGIVLETYAQISSNASMIDQRVIKDKTMPPSAPLSAADIATLKCWISAGSPNN